MYAIVDIAGQQFKVSKNQKVYVNRLQSEEGSMVTFDKVMLLSDKESITIGTPTIGGVCINAKVLNHLKGDKVVVFKKKRRKGYKKKNGHRQYLSQIQIESIVLPGSKDRKPEKENVKQETAKAKADDLKKIEGIGPKIAQIFNDAGIVTFADLAQAKVERLKEILTEAGPRYDSKNPTSWPKQSKMAAEGKWEELDKWQSEVKGGIE